MSDQTQNGQELMRGLADIRSQIEQLNLAPAVFAAIGITKEEFLISLIDSDKTVTIKNKSTKKDKHQEVIDWLAEYTNSHNVKIVAAALLGMLGEEKNGSRSLGARLWLEKDIVPYFFPVTETISEKITHRAAWEVSNYFDDKHLVKIRFGNHNEVIPSFLVNLSDYKKTVPADHWQLMTDQVEKFKKAVRKIIFFNATPQGGGVALMRHALMRLFRLWGVEAHWHVVHPNKDVFDITKTKFHNVLQGVAPSGVELTQRDQHLFNTWSHENAVFFKPIIQKADVVVIDDPQPSGMIPWFREFNPSLKIMYRSHIQLDTRLIAKKDSPQERSWQFIWNNIKSAEVFLSHPVLEFIPEEMLPRTLLMPATTDALDGLNKPLAAEGMQYYLKLFNKVLLEHDQKQLDLSRPYIIQTARFDPAKGIPDVIESFRILREKLGEKENLPQLVLVGHGSIDDPDGVPIYNMIIHLLRDARYSAIAQDVKVVRLHHNDQILNALLRGSKIALQLSHKEGFEVKVTESLHKGKPIVAYRTGGIPLQVRDGETGFLIERGNCVAVAEKLYQLMTDEAMYQKMSQAAVATLTPEYFTVHNALKWLWLANQILDNKKLPGQAEFVKTLIGSPLA